MALTYIKSFMRVDLFKEVYIKKAKWFYVFTPTREIHTFALNPSVLLVARPRLPDNVKRTFL